MAKYGIIKNINMLQTYEDARNEELGYGVEGPSYRVAKFGLLGEVEMDIYKFGYDKEGSVDKTTVARYSGRTLTDSPDGRSLQTFHNGSAAEAQSALDGFKQEYPGVRADPKIYYEFMLDKDIALDEKRTEMAGALGALLHERTEQAALATAMAIEGLDCTAGIAAEAAIQQ